MCLRMCSYASNIFSEYSRLASEGHHLDVESEPSAVSRAITLFSIAVRTVLPIFSPADTGIGRRKRNISGLKGKHRNGHGLIIIDSKEEMNCCNWKNIINVRWQATTVKLAHCQQFSACCLPCVSDNAHLH